MKIGLLQYNCFWEDKSANINYITKLVNNFKEDIDLLILPELSLTGFTMNSEKFAENEKADTFNFYNDISQKKNCAVIGGMIEEENSHYYNTVIVVKNNEVLAKYRKIHLFSLANENKNYTPGNKITTFEYNGMKFGLTICYDLRFPELYRLYAKKRVDAIINIANWPIPRITHWETLLKARSIENLCYVIGVNRTGLDNLAEYNGTSSIYDPMGNLLTTSHDDKILTAEIYNEVVNNHRNKFKFLNDMKDNLYV